MNKPLKHSDIFTADEMEYLSSIYPDPRYSYRKCIAIMLCITAAIVVGIGAFAGLVLA